MPRIHSPQRARRAAHRPNRSSTSRSFIMKGRPATNSWLPRAGGGERSRLRGGGLSGGYCGLVQHPTHCWHANIHGDVGRLEIRVSAGHSRPQAWLAHSAAPCNNCRPGWHIAQCPATAGKLTEMPQRGAVSADRGTVAAQASWPAAGAVSGAGLHAECSDNRTQHVRPRAADMYENVVAMHAHACREACTHKSSPSHVIVAATTPAAAAAPAATAPPASDGTGRPLTIVTSGIVGECSK